LSDKTFTKQVTTNETGPLLPQEIIRIKRDGGILTAQQIGEFIAGVTDGSLSEGQIGAFNMAVFLRGMTVEERVAFALAMRDSGDVCDWSQSGLPPATIIDKHSSGGVGDEKASLLIVPLVAACGIHIPMISGRGLGHTGGEVDLIEAIPGYTIAPSLERFMATVCKIGCALIGPTPRLAPADAAIFKVRDVTATVESIPLITGSIMSKKLAAGMHGLVMTVNFGRGAFMQTLEQAEELAQSMLGVATGAGVKTIIFLGHMDEVMGDAIGSRPQLREVAAFLSGKHREARLYEVVTRLSAEILLLGRLAETFDQAIERVREKLNDGSATAKFSAMVAELGGPADFLNQLDGIFPTTPIVRAVPSPADGFITSVDARQVGWAMVGLGAGRRHPQQPLDHDVGLTGMVHVGDRIERGEPLCTLYARSETSFQAAADAILSAVTVGPIEVAASLMFATRLAN
jgi:thymidine phosphorylase